MTLTFDDRGLIPAIAQDRLTGQVRMVAWMNADAVRLTLETGKATFFSRSRGALWIKGETSGHHLAVHSVYADCDADTLLLLVDPEGPSCHTGRPTCFFRRLEPDGDPARYESRSEALSSRISKRRSRNARRRTPQRATREACSRAEPAKIGGKIREEAAELADAIDAETEDRVANEAADLLYHVLVGLKLRGVPLRRVIEVLASRAGTSGHDEKASRKG